MKKGFTLVELLIVMVIVGTLVTVALPRYRAALERGRVQEALANLKTASELINTQYVLNGNNYTDLSGLLNDDNTFKDKGMFSKGTLFSTPTVQIPDQSDPELRVIFVKREGGDYSLEAHNYAGELKEIRCIGDGDNTFCAEAGMEPIDGLYKIDLTDF